MSTRRPAELTGTLLGPERYSAGDEAFREVGAPTPRAPQVDPRHRQPLADQGGGGPVLGWRNAILFGAISGLALAVAVVAGSLMTENPAAHRAGQVDAAVKPAPPAAKPLLTPRTASAKRQPATRKPVPKAAARKAMPKPVARKAAPRNAKAAQPLLPPPRPPPAPARGLGESSGSGKPVPQFPPGANFLARPKPPPVRRLVAIPDPPDAEPPKPRTVLRRTGTVTKLPPIPPLARRKPTIATTAFAIQLSALRSETAAKREVSRLQKRFRTLLAGREFHIRPARIRGATLYRVHVDGFSGSARARKLCARMRASRQTCLVVRP